jgi:hypothetical protein
LAGEEGGEVAARTAGGLDEEDLGELKSREEVEVEGESGDRREGMSGSSEQGVERRKPSVSLSKQQ